MNPELIEKLGLPIAMTISMAGAIVWVMKITIKHFIETIKEQTEERRETNSAFLNAIEELTKSIGLVNITVTGIDRTVEEIDKKTNSLLRVVHGKRA